MNVDVMRALDRWLGIPLCAAATLCHRLNPFRRRKRGGPRSVLFIKLSEMGTSVFFPPLLARLSEAHPGCECFLLVFRENAPIVRQLGFIPPDNILEVRTDGVWALVRDLIRHVAAMRRRRVDAVIDCEFFSRISALIARWVGSPTRVGFDRLRWEGLYRGQLLTHLVGFNPTLHTAQNYAFLIDALDREPGEVVFHAPVVALETLYPQSMQIGDDAKERLWQKLGALNPVIRRSTRLIILNPDTGELLPYRKWPERHFVELGKELAAIENVGVVLTGVARSVDLCERIRQQVNAGNVLNLAGETDLSELFVLYSIASALVSVDSGPVHFAALTGIAIVCIFGPDTPVAFAPLSSRSVSLTCGLSCHPCFSVFNNRLAHCHHDEKPCLLSITPKRVVAELEALVGLRN